MSLKSRFQNAYLKLIILYKNILKTTLVFLVNFYQSSFALIFGGSCRFHPTCSAYAKEALQKHDTFFALKIITQRLLKCHPLGSKGYDPVPAQNIKGKSYE